MVSVSMTLFYQKLRELQRSKEKFCKLRLLNVIRKLLGITVLSSSMFWVLYQQFMTIKSTGDVEVMDKFASSKRHK